MVFILLTMDFKNIIGGTHKSGFSTSEVALYFIKVDGIVANDSKIFSFGHNLFGSESEPFDAPLLFYKNLSQSSLAGLHCYCCSTNLVVTENLTFSHLKGLSNHLNSAGYNRKIWIPSTNLHSHSKFKSLLSRDQLKIRGSVYTIII